MKTTAYLSVNTNTRALGAAHRRAFPIASSCNVRRGTKRVGLSHVNPWRAAMGYGDRVVKLDAWRLGLHRPKPLDRVGDLFDRSDTRVFVAPSRDPGDRVVVNPRPGGNHLPGPVTLERLKCCLDLIESHAPSLGASALKVNASAPNAPQHHFGMPSDRAPKTAFQENLLRLIGKRSVNAWAGAHKLEQTTIQRLVNGADPKLSMIERIAGAVGIEPYKLLAPGLVVEDQSPQVQAIEQIEHQLADLLAQTQAAKSDLLQGAIRTDASSPVEQLVEDQARRGVR